MVSKYLLLLIPCLLLTTQGLGQAPPAARPLGEFFSSLTGKQLRKLADGRDSIEKAQTNKELNAILTSKEVGKKATLKFTSSGKAMIVMDNQISLSGDSEKSMVRVSGETILVRIIAEVPPSMEDKVKQCREGRKVFVSGTVKSIGIGYSAPLVRMSNGQSGYGANRFTASITVTADAFGLDK